MQIVERAIEVLRVVARNGRGITLMELSHVTGLVPSTLHRHLSALLRMGYLWRDPNTKLYSPGGEAAVLGSVWIDQESLHAILRNAVVSTGPRVGETAFAMQSCLYPLGGLRG